MRNTTGFKLSLLNQQQSTSIFLVNPTRRASPRQLAMGSDLFTVLRIEYAEGKQIEGDDPS